MGAGDRSHLYLTLSSWRGAFIGELQPLVHEPYQGSVLRF